MTSRGRAVGAVTGRLLSLLGLIGPLVPPDRRRQATRWAEHLAGQGSPPSACQATVWNVLRGSTAYGSAGTYG